MTTVLCKVEDTWEAARALPKSCRGLIVLNLQSYAGGRNLWGKDKETTSDDGVLEIVTVDDVFSLGWKLVTTKGLGPGAGDSPGARSCASARPRPSTCKLTRAGLGAAAGDGPHQGDRPVAGPRRLV